MSDELVEQLRFLGLDEAADEIERLRNRYEILSSLITAWADADDADENGIDNSQFHECDCERPYCMAARELRKAVKR